MTKQYKEQPLLDTITDYNGNVWNDQQVKVYNDYTRRINKSANKPLSDGSLALEERESLLARRAAYYAGVASLITQGGI